MCENAFGRMARNDEFFIFNRRPSADELLSITFACKSDDMYNTFNNSFVVMITITIHLTR